MGWCLTIPPSLYMSYQMMFAVITPALITGAIADRVRFGAWAWFVGIWVVSCYAPVAHWVFSPVGWLARRGALDFAGGTVVHVNAGIAALAVVLVIGRRRGWPHTPMPPHSLPADTARHRHPVVRMVRIQRRLGAAGRRSRGAGAGEHAHGRGRGDARLGCGRAVALRPGDDPRRGIGRGCGSRRDHAVRGIRRRDVADRDRC